MRESASELFWKPDPDPTQAAGSGSATLPLALAWNDNALFIFLYGKGFCTTPVERERKVCIGKKPMWNYLLFALCEYKVILFSIIRALFISTHLPCIMVDKTFIHGSYIYVHTTVFLCTLTHSFFFLRSINLASIFYFYLFNFL